MFSIDRLHGLLLYLNHDWTRASTSAEKNFCGLGSGFLFATEALFVFLYGVFWFVFAVLAWCSMLFSVKFHVVKREVRVLLEIRLGCWFESGISNLICSVVQTC